MAAPKKKRKSTPSKRAKAVAKSKRVIDKILDRVMQGESLRSICSLKGFPDLRTVLRWSRNDEDFSVAYDEACKVRAMLYVDTVVDLSKRATDKSNADAIRVQIDAVKWAAGKMHPRKYSDKIDITSDGEKITSVTYEVVKSKNEPENKGK